MNLDIDPRYSTFSTSIVLYLLHNSKEYNDLWISKYPDTTHQAENYFKDENCGCRPVLLRKYAKLRFDIDAMTVNFINSNPNLLNFNEFCDNIGFQDLHGVMFSVPNNPGDYKDFLSSLKQKNVRFNGFNTTSFDNEILITFF